VARKVAQDKLGRDFSDLARNDFVFTNGPDVGLECEVEHRALVIRVNFKITDTVCNANRELSRCLGVLVRNEICIQGFSVFVQVNNVVVLVHDGEGQLILSARSTIVEQRQRLLCSDNEYALTEKGDTQPRLLSVYTRNNTEFPAFFVCDFDLNVGSLCTIRQESQLCRVEIILTQVYSER